MANKTTNYNLTKPLPEEFYDIGVHNDNMDIIDTELKKRATLSNGKVPTTELPIGTANGVAGLDSSGKLPVSSIPDSVANQSVDINEQTPTYTQASTLANIASGEKLSVSMGKIMKAIADFISHLSNKSNPHGVTASQAGALSSTGGTLKGKFGVSYSTFVNDNPNACAVVSQGTDGDVGFYNELETNVYCGLRVQPVDANTTDISNHLRFRVRNNNFNHMYQLYGSHNLDALATALGASKIQTGSYTGTGYSENGKTISFSITPKIVFVGCNKNASKTSCPAIFLRPFTSGSADGGSATTVTWGTNSMTLNGSGSESYCNTSNYVYHWLAIE